MKFNPPLSLPAPLRGLLLGLLLLCSPFLSSSLLAEESRSFDGEITVAIVEKDTVFARNSAFRSLKYSLLAKGVEYLIGEELYLEHQDAFLQQRLLKPNKYIDSVQVIKEESQGKEFYMHISGSILLEALERDLKNLNFPILKDRATKIALVIDSKLQLPESNLKKRLGLFKIKPIKTIQLNLQGVTTEERETVPFAESLFKKLPKSAVIFFAEIIYDEANPSKAIGIAFRVYRKTDKSQINRFLMSFPPTSPKQIPKLLKKQNKQFLALFSRKSILQNSFFTGEKASLQILIRGLTSPWARSSFETQVLKRQSLIKSFKLKKFSTLFAEYSVETKGSIQKILSTLTQPHPQFTFEVLQQVSNQITLQATFNKEPQIAPLKEFQLQRGVMDKIAFSLGLKEDEEVAEENIPLLSEKEPNNSFSRIHTLPFSTLVYASLSSRADNDIYTVIPDSESKGIKIEWTRLSRTNLSPQVRLYDENLNHLNTYSMSWGSRKSTFTYKFKDGVAPHRIYIRIGDRIGYIRNETGGFKNCEYMISYAPL